MIAILLLAFTVCTSSLQASEPTESEVAKRNPFTAVGHVTDQAGYPIADANVRVATGIGTLIGGGSTKTDENGKFKLHFGPGMKVTANPDSSPLGVGVQAAQFYVSKQGMKLPDKKGYVLYLMSDFTPEKFEKMLEDEGGKYWSKSDSSEVVFAHAPKEIDFVLIKETAVSKEGDESKVIWGKSRQGLAAGAKLLSATGELKPGDPIVVQFVLKNDSNKKRSVVLKRTQGTHPTIGENNRLELNLLGSSQEKTQHNLEPGEILEDAKYRVTVSTDGMPAGKYSITSGTAFWMVKDGKSNGATGIPFRKSIPVTLGASDTVTARQPPDEDPKVWWGSPAGNLILGMRLIDDRKFWPTDRVDIEGQLFLFNAGDEALELTYELPPTPADWNMHVTGEGDKFVRLDSTWYSGIEPTRHRTISIDPGLSIALTGMEAGVSTGGKDPVDTKIQGPLVRVLKAKTEFEYGDPKRLIGQTGNFFLNAAVTIRMKEMADPVIVASSAPVPFTIGEKSEASKSSETKD